MPLTVTVILPCLDEAKTIEHCVTEALSGLDAAGREGEVLVVDNGSNDGSRELAEAAGARVVREARRGYGSALSRGVREAKGEIVVFSDADGSYVFDNLAPLLDGVDAGADLMMGTRLKGTVEAGAMPWSHRHIGTPVLTFLVNLLFRTKISDINCGQRAFLTSSARKLDLRATGMEFASENIIKSALAGFEIREVPIVLRKDLRDRAPHLRTWRDGWRHLRFILLFAPNMVLIAPGLALFLVGAALGAPIFLGDPGLPPAAAYSASALVLLGAQFITVGVIAKTWYHVEGFYKRPYLDTMFRFFNLEMGLVAGSGLILIGLIAGWPLVDAWRFDATPDPAGAMASLTFLVLGLQTITASIILSVLGIRKRASGP